MADYSLALVKPIGRFIGSRSRENIDPGFHCAIWTTGSSHCSRGQACRWPLQGGASAPMSTGSTPRLCMAHENGTFKAMYLGTSADGRREIVKLYK